MTAHASSHSTYPFISPLCFSIDEALVTRLQQIVQCVVELLNLEDCAIALLDEQQANCMMLATSQEEPVKYVSFPLHPNLVAVVEKQQLGVFTSMHMNARMQPLDADVVHTLACIPLLDQQHVLGVLTASTSTLETLAPRTLQLLSLLAEQAALTLLNARQTELMRDANRIKANFLSLVTHELRSPLNAINGYLDLTLEGLAGVLTEQQREFLQRARAGSEHLYTLIEDLLLASRADAGQLRLSRTPVTFSSLVSDALEELEITAKNAGVSLKAEIPTEFPTLVVDAVRMQQVLRNLLSNALRWTPAGGRITISAQDKVEQEQIEIRVTDTGSGIAPIHHERIFERFFQVPSAEGGRISGQGLGLAIVKMIVELHGGTIGVESAPNEGCTFIIMLNSGETHEQFRSKS